MSRYIKHTFMGEDLSPDTGHGNYNYIKKYLSEIDGFDMRGSDFGGSGNHCMVFAEVILMCVDVDESSTSGCIVKRIAGSIGFDGYNYAEENDYYNVYPNIEEATEPFGVATVINSVNDFNPPSGWWPFLSCSISIPKAVQVAPAVDNGHILQIEYEVASGANARVHWEINLRFWKPN